MQSFEFVTVLAIFYLSLNMAFLKEVTIDHVNATIDETESSSLASLKEISVDVREIHGVVDKLHHAFTAKSDHSEKRHQFFVKVFCGPHAHKLCRTYCSI